MKVISVCLVSIGLWGGTVAAQENNLMLNNSQTFINTPYVANTLEQNEGETESLIVNCDKVDCTTLVEYVLAMSLCPRQGDDMQESDFLENLQRIRYRNGLIDGYTSRLHYISDWINNSVRGGFLQDVTAVNSPDTDRLAISYMSNHPAQYVQLTHSATNVAKMKQYEKALTGQEIHWIPKAKLPVGGFPWIKNGDIIAITTNIPGLDIAHMGIAVYIKGALCLLHASSSKGKVLAGDLPLNHLLERNNKWTGVRVLRMKK